MEEEHLVNINLAFTKKYHMQIMLQLEHRRPNNNYWNAASATLYRTMIYFNSVSGDQALKTNTGLHIIQQIML